MKMNNLFLPRLLFTLLLSLLSRFVFGQEPLSENAKPPSIFEVLTPKEAVKMTLETDLTTIIEQRKTNQYFPGTLRTEDGKVYKVELRSRGKFRRKISVYPPLKMKFKKKALVAEGLDTLNEVKIVLPCFENSKGDELIVREYLAYKMYEQLTNVSLRARLIRLTIRDTHVEKTKRQMYAILLEDEEELVARLKGELNEEYGIPADSFQTNQAALMVMFQYMIGNTDWEVSMLRNVRMVRVPATGKILLIPYDFDFAGLVGAPYASPNSDTGLKNVRDRYLMTSGLKPEALRRALNILSASKQQLYSICKSKHLDYSASEDMVKYLRRFFEKVEGKAEIPQVIYMEND